MHTNLELFSRIFVDVRRTQNRVTSFCCGQRNGSANFRTRSFDSFDNRSNSSVKHSMVIRLELESNFFHFCFLNNIKEHTSKIAANHAQRGNCERMFCVASTFRTRIIPHSLSFCKSKREIFALFAQFFCILFPYQKDKYAIPARQNGDKAHKARLLCYNTSKRSGNRYSGKNL